MRVLQGQTYHIVHFALAAFDSVEMANSDGSTLWSQ